ncbi:MAG: ATPase [Hyphomicrobiales bacterium]|nr:ATPase [Hyphomicrobiales bacterium]
MKPNILIVEDIPLLAESYAAFLRDEGTHIDIEGTGAGALASLERRPASVVVLDVNLPDISGIEVLQRIRAMGMPAEVVVVTAEGSVKLAVEAMRHGALDFIVKPFTADRLRITVRNALERRRMADQIATIQEESSPERFAGFIGQSLSMEAVYRILRSAAPTNATVFVTGESGTGKELCADALHKLSKRKSGPFVVINCAAIPRDLLESEIFGHVKGAFTGATADRRGAALQANGGTLFLDEVCEMDLALQAKMLRFLQDKQVHRLGEDSPRPTDVRIVCATNRDPQSEVAAGRFREDLFYRLHVVPVELPPLRERDADALLIARSFLEKFSREDGRRFRGFTPEAESVLVSYAWPGNVRQLQNAVRSIVVLNEGELVTPEMLPREVLAGIGAGRLTMSPVAPALPPPLLPGAFAPVDERPADALQPVPASAAAPGLSRSAQPITPLETVIRQTIEHAIERSGGSIPKAAAALEVSPSTLYRRIQAWQSGESAA